MKVIVQRALDAKVIVNNTVVGKIDKGLVLLVGFTNGDTEKEIDYMVRKIINLRIFDDQNGIMNLSIKDIGGQILSISQFTLYANTKDGNRPSYIDALNQNDANKLYNIFNERLKTHIHVETGIFREDMKISFINNGPVTIILEK